MAMLGSSTPGGDASPARPPHLAARTWRSSSGTAAGFEGGETLADVHCDPQLPVDAVDPSIDPPDLGEQFRLQRDRIGPESVDLDRQAGADPLAFLVRTADLLVEDADIAAQRVKLRRDDVLECRFHLVVDTHRDHFNQGHRDGSMS